MFKVTIEWIETLCTYLMAVCDLQLITTAILAITIPDVLWLTGSNFCTGAGLMASLIALPTALRLKTAQTSPNMDRIYGYTLCYQRLAICVSSAFHLVAIILTIIALIITTNLCKDFMRLMRGYHAKQSSKALVDNVQFALQCCGAENYEDWFGIDWEGYQLVGGMRREKHSIEKLLREDTDVYPDLALIRNDGVPFSCCRRSILSQCVHQNIIQLGTNTISLHGCGKKLRSAARWLLWFEFFAYALSLALEIAILLLLKKQPPMEKNKKILDPQFDSFTNSLPSGNIDDGTATTSHTSFLRSQIVSYD